MRLAEPRSSQLGLLPAPPPPPAQRADKVSGSSQFSSDQPIPVLRGDERIERHQPSGRPSATSPAARRPAVAAPAARCRHQTMQSASFCRPPPVTVDICLDRDGWRCAIGEASPAALTANSAFTSVSAAEPERAERNVDMGWLARSMAAEIERGGGRTPMLSMA